MQPYPHLHDSCPPLQPEPPPTHVADFYEPDFFPAQSIATYLCEGLEAGEISLIIATPDHTRAVNDSLRRCGVEPEALERAGLLSYLDASSILEAMKDNSALCDGDAKDVLGELLAKTAQLSPSARVRVFDEMANLLAADGDYSACLRLEMHWNWLLAAYPFRLYCPYCISGFAKECSAATIAAVCRSHDQIIPFVSAGPTGWLAPLLQQSSALQVEIQKCRAGQGALHALEREYTRLFGEHVAHLRHGLEDRLHLASSGKRLLFPPPQAGLDHLVERLLHEILVECEAVCAARRSAPEGGPESQKYIGEILAYGRLTSALCGLQQRVRSTDSGSAALDRPA